MKIKTIIGWTALLAISLIPVYLWGHFGPGTEDLTDYAHITHSLGEIFGLVGMTMFALTFILSTRITWLEDVFGGLDKVYITHGILGGSALILIMAHPIFLVLKFIPNEVYRAAIYLLPSAYWSVNFGIMALVGMIALIFITLYSKMKYNRWKFTHEFLGLMFILAVLHIFMVRGSVTQDNIFNGYYGYAAVVSAIGIFGFSYSLFLKNRLFKNAIYVVSSVKSSGDLFEITMSPEHKPIAYKSGQFVMLRFYNQKISREAHPFSIASKSNATDIVVVVKKLGDYTSALGGLNKGDKVAIEGPYGRFNYQQYRSTNQVWIAGGIGITPFIGMVQDIVDDAELKGKITLIYSVNTASDIIGNELFRRIDKNYSHFTFVPWISKTQGRLSAASIKEKCGGNLLDTEFFLCGPPMFKQSIMDDMAASGVSRDRMHEEAFDFR